MPSKLSTAWLWTRRCVDKVYSKSRCCSNGGSHVLEEAGVLRVHTGHQRGFYPNIWPTLPCTGQKTRVRDMLLPQRHRHGDKTEVFLCRSPVFTLSSYHEARVKDVLLMLSLLIVQCRSFALMLVLIWSRHFVVFKQTCSQQRLK